MLMGAEIPSKTICKILWKHSIAQSECGKVLCEAGEKYRAQTKAEWTKQNECKQNLNQPFLEHEKLCSRCKLLILRSFFFRCHSFVLFFEIRWCLNKLFVFFLFKFIKRRFLVFHFGFAVTATVKQCTKELGTSNEAEYSNEIFYFSIVFCEIFRSISMVLQQRKRRCK